MVDEPGGGSSWGAGRTAREIMRSMGAASACGKLMKLGLGRAAYAAAICSREHPRDIARRPGSTKSRRGEAPGVESPRDHRLGL